MKKYYPEGHGWPENITRRKDRRADAEPATAALTKEMIFLPRVVIKNQDEDSYTVDFGGQAYKISKSDETSFMLGGGGSGGAGVGMRQELRQELAIKSAHIEQDENAPDDFKEVMMFHEIREMEYKQAGFTDAHERAVQDEVLYITKYFDDQRRAAYVEFASAARTKNAECQPGKEVEGEWLTAEKARRKEAKEWLNQVFGKLTNDWGYERLTDTHWPGQGYIDRDLRPNEKPIEFVWASQVEKTGGLTSDKGKIEWKTAVICDGGRSGVVDGYLAFLDPSILMNAPLIINLDYEIIGKNLEARQTSFREKISALQNDFARLTPEDPNRSQVKFVIGRPFEKDPQTIIQFISSMNKTIESEFK